MVLVWRVLGAETFVVGCEVAATWFYLLSVGTVAFADVVPDFLVGAARDPAGRLCSVLVANTAGLCGGAASWYRALLWLSPTVLVAVPVR